MRKETGIDPAFTATARRIGIAAALAVVILGLAYAVTLALGYLSLESPQRPIGDPHFTILEILILVMMPAMVALMAAVHAWAPMRAKTLSLISLIFMALLAGITCSVHFAILTLSRQPAISAQPWFRPIFSFEWPSLAYALDILGWDIFFALSMLFAAPAFRGSRLAVSIGLLMAASGMLALAGLSGVAIGDMQVRNIGIAGYLGAFLAAATLLGILFHRTAPAES
jgi:hypothetical protein